MACASQISCLETSSPLLSTATKSHLFYLWLLYFLTVRIRKNSSRNSIGQPYVFPWPLLDVLREQF